MAVQPDAAVAVRVTSISKESAPAPAVPQAAAAEQLSSAEHLPNKFAPITVPSTKHNNLTNDTAPSAATAVWAATATSVVALGGLDAAQHTPTVVEAAKEDTVGHNNTKVTGDVAAGAHRSVDAMDSGGGGTSAAAPDAAAAAVARPRKVATTTLT